MKWTKRIPVGYDFGLAIKATKECIKKRWIPFSNGKKGGDCKLCDLYGNGGETYCQFCPISFKTEKQWCEGTPFITWSDNYSRIHDCILAIHYAREEVKFLEKLVVDLKAEQALRKAKKAKVRK